MFRAIVLTHRYVGIAVGLLMAVWCLSGVVMMYVPYPRLAEERRIAGLAEIDWSRCCSFDSGAVADGASGLARMSGHGGGGARGGDARGGGAIAGDARVSSFQLEMLGARPVLRVVVEEGGPRVIDLRSGAVVDAVADDDALAAADALARSMLVSGEARARGLILRDQWTVAYNRGERPIHEFAFSDPAKTVAYVSSTSGKVLQVTQSSQRFWNWLGSVPHWLYPTVLRQHTVVWAQVVIWASVIGTFLTATGLYLGIKELRRRQNGRFSSPHRGVMYWHHVPGLVFGVLVLTWTVSGLFSMNPWGMMEAQGIGEDVELLAGEPPRWGEVRQLVQSVAARAPSGVVSLSSAPFGGRVFAIAWRASGARERFDAGGSLSTLGKEEVVAAAQRLQRGDAPARWSILDAEDGYYYSTHTSPAAFPVVRIVTGSDGGSDTSEADMPLVRYNLDPISGRLVNKVDAGSKAFRWWHSALHTFDFSSLTRSAWFRNGLMLPLLLGAAVVCVTGTWLGIRRLTR